jgi:GNAT superfamily N-acetyltransferase
VIGKKGSYGRKENWKTQSLSKKSYEPEESSWLNMQEFKTRVATKRDARAIENVILEWSRERWPNWQPERERTIHSVLKDKSHLLLISTTPEAVAGVLHLVFYPDVVTGSLNCHLNFLLTKKEHRKKGIGCSLLDEAVSYARSRGANEMHVDTIFGEAAEFYRKYGFKDDGVWLELSLRNRGAP